MRTAQCSDQQARTEDIEPNLECELARHADTDGNEVSFNKEARERYLQFAVRPDAVWSANFRDLSASITRMATLAPSGRITPAIVDEEIERLLQSWRKSNSNMDGDVLMELLGTQRLASIDLFDQAQLASVIKVCRQSRSLSAAGRTLFAASRAAKASSNDADRLKKYLARFELNFEQVSAKIAC